MFKPRPVGPHRSDRHGVIERDPTLALSGPLLDPGDIAAYGAVAIGPEGIFDAIGIALSLPSAAFRGGGVQKLGFSSSVSHAAA